MKLSTKLLAVFLLFVFTNAAFASSEQGHHAATLYDIRFFYLHFLIFVWLLYKLTNKPVASAWHAWRENIQASVEKGTKALDAAEEALQMAEGKLSTLPQALSEMTTRIKHETETESKEIIEEAKRKSVDIKKRGEENIKAEKLAAEKAYQRTLATNALAQAKSLLEKRVDAKSDSKRREDALSGIGRFGALQ